MSRETSDLVSQSLRLDLADFGQDLLVDVEVVRQLHVVLFDQDLGGFLDGFGSDSALRGEEEEDVRKGERNRDLGECTIFTTVCRFL